MTSEEMEFVERDGSRVELRTVTNEVNGDSERIKELGEKATQLLLFLTFALVAAITLRTAEHNQLGSYQASALRLAIRFWSGALFPILVSVLPVKEIIGNLRFVRITRSPSSGLQ